MIVVDSSAWIEYLRRTESSVDRYVTHLIDQDQEIALTEVICMELLAGARDDAHLDQLRALTHRYPTLPLQGLASFEDAAALYAQCRRSGLTIRKLADCLIAVVCISARVPLLSVDRDFEAISKVADLALVHPSS